MNPPPDLDRKLVDKLEQELERAIADIIQQHSKILPLGPDQRTMHLMAKAAVTVYETAAHHSQA